MMIKTFAIVSIPDHGPRPAALVFLTPNGAAWVEPAYLIPEPTTMPSFHRVYGTVKPQGEGFTVTDSAGRAAEFQPATRALDDADGTCAAAMANWSDLLVDLGRTEEEEHARVEAMLVDELA